MQEERVRGYLATLTSAAPSRLGIAVALLLDDVWRGIYHLNRTSLSRVEWHNTHHVSVVVDPHLNTYDDDKLTALVVLTHDRMLRMSVEARAYRYLALVFHQRHQRSGSLFYRLPTMEDHMALIRRAYNTEVYQHG